MKADKIQALRFLDATGKTFKIPVYQRNYNWQERQCIKLFEDIENIVINNFNITHFIGTVVYVEGVKNYEFEDCVIVDGQQRITTLTLILKAIMDTLAEDKKIKKEQIYDSYLVHKYKEGENARLILCKDDFDNWKKILNNDFEEVDKASCIYQNYILFKKLISESKFSCEDIFKALNNLELVYIMLEKTENPQLIFESLNSTGLSLTQGDLIRNYLLMNHEYEKQTRLYLNYWYKIEKKIGNIEISNFISTYLSMKTGKSVKENELYEKFREFKTKKILKEENLDEEYFLEELLLYSKYYSWFINIDCPYENINYLLNNIETLKSTVVYPTLLYFFEETFEYKNISINELEEILKTIITYLVRRKICEYKSNQLKSIFCSIPVKIQNEKEKEKGTDYKQKLIHILIRDINNSSFPKNKEFKEKFVKYNLYKSREFCRYILFEIEKFKNNKELLEDTEEIQIEHIMPQKLNSSWEIALGKDYEKIHKEYINTIGNLTLTGYNAKLSNNSFDNKVFEYKDSNFSITRDICRFNNWDRESIEARAKDFYKIAEKIWFLDDQYNKDYEKADVNIEYYLSDDINFTSTKPKNITIYNVTYSIDSWKDFLKIICKYFYRLDKSIFRSFILDKDFCPNTKKIIDSDDLKMSSPFEIDEGLYIETNFNANYLLSISKLIAEKYGFEDNITFRLK